MELKINKKLSRFRLSDPAPLSCRPYTGTHTHIHTVLYIYTHNRVACINTHNTVSHTRAHTHTNRHTQSQVLPTGPSCCLFHQPVLVDDVFPLPVHPTHTEEHTVSHTNKTQTMLWQGLSTGPSNYLFSSACTGRRCVPSPCPPNTHPHNACTHTGTYSVTHRQCYEKGYQLVPATVFFISLNWSMTCCCSISIQHTHTHTHT